MVRTLNDIIPPSRRRQMPQEGMMQEPMSAPPSSPPPMRPRPLRSSSGFPYGTAIVALLVIAGAVGALFYFSGARVDVTPKTYATAVDGEFTATASTGDLPYKIITAEKVGSQSVKAESTAQATDSAQGTITIQNAQAVSQPLITNTRFESANGLIYRIHAAVTVPPGSAANPGTVTVPVFADKPGAEYNIAAGSFTVPGLKGGAAFSLVTAKSSAPMTGGFSGMRPSVSDATHKAQVAAIQTALAPQVEAALASQLPDGYILIPGGTTTSFTPQSDTATSDTVTISVKGTASGIAFPNGALAKAIAYKTQSMYAGEPVTISSPAGLTLSDGSSTPDGSNPFTFSLSGNTTLVWGVDPAKIAGAVAGKKRDSAQSILAGFIEIDKAVLVLRPFFASTFPDDPAKIKVTILDPLAKH